MSSCRQRGADVNPKTVGRRGATKSYTVTETNPRRLGKESLYLMLRNVTCHPEQGSGGGGESERERASLYLTLRNVVTQNKEVGERGPVPNAT